MSIDRYSNGVRKQDQIQASKEYRAKQRQLRDWADAVAADAGLGNRDRLLNMSSAELVASIINHERKTSL